MFPYLKRQLAATEKVQRRARFGWLNLFKASLQRGTDRDQDPRGCRKQGDYTQRYTVATRMTPVLLRWAAMRAILMFH